MKYFLPGTLCLLLVTVVFATTVKAQENLASTTVVENTAQVVSGPDITKERIPGSDVQLGDFVVGPGKVEVVVRPGETVYRDITVTNRIDDNRSFQFIVEDMSGSADGSEAVVLLGDQDGPYSLKDYVSVPADSIDLALGERARVPVRITMPPNAEPGGYYGAVLVSTLSNDANATEAVGDSPIIARIGTLFFITVPGETVNAGELIQFSTIGDKRWFSKGPITFGITYENTGSVHQNPYGEIRITNTLGAEVGFVELDPWFVLPQSVRTREVTWNSEVLLGRYKVTAQINRGDDTIDTASVYIWVIPWQFLALTFGTLFVLIFVVRWFFSRFEFKRK
jgi:hypothetical protein